MLMLIIDKSSFGQREDRPSCRARSVVEGVIVLYTAPAHCYLPTAIFHF